ncbi:hypothetical protein WDZ92_45675, partial [Nostoc sp. NIES-2111]
QTERQREAADIRAQGSQESQRIRAEADRDVVVIRANATRESEILRGRGDAERNRILSQAFGRDPEFFAFWRSMQAYEEALKAGGTQIVMSPNSEFFRYFSSATSGGKPGDRLPGTTGTTPPAQGATPAPGPSGAAAPAQPAPSATP